MIESVNLTKRYDNVTAVDHISAVIRDGNVFGLVGTNGAGKSTFLKLAAGILKPDEGSISIDGAEVFENPAVKGSFFYISDDQYFFPNAAPSEMMRFYQSLYPGFDTSRFQELMKAFDLPSGRKISTYSKGMKKQLSILLGLCARTRYLFCDETFDGLDPVMRQAVKSLMAGEIEERGLTPVITSHNLRELEDICDHVGLLHKGGILFSRDLDEMKLSLHKLQLVLHPGMKIEDLPDLDIVLKEQRGSIYTLTVRGDAQEILHRMEAYAPLFYELVPLTLEEIFISETEVNGYDIKNLIL